jgi:hypothetical protein
LIECDYGKAQYPYQGNWADEPRLGYGTYLESRVYEHKRTRKSKDYVITRLVRLGQARIQ